MSVSANLGITHINTAQAQKEVTANAAFDAIDLAMTGFLSASITGLSTYGFTGANGVVTQCLMLTGTNAGAFPVTIPAAKKTYEIVNTTAGTVVLTVSGTSNTLTIGAGVNAHIYCDGSNAYAIGLSAVSASLASLTDLGISSPSDGQTLVYNGTTHLWCNTAPVIPNLHSLTDVNVAEGSGINGKALVWDNGTGKWIAAALTTTLATLTDVAGTPADGKVLTWVASASKWEPQAVPGMAYSGLTDVNITAIANGQYMTWNAGTSKWVNAVPITSLAGMTTDVVISGPGTSQVLAYDGTNWVNTTISGLVATALSGMSDVNVAEGSGIDGKVLTWVNSAGKWQAVAIPSMALSGLTDVNVSEGAGIDGKFLKWDNGTSKWVTVTVAQTIAAQADATITSPTNNQLLTYSTTDSKWENSSHYYDIGLTIEGSPTNSETVMRYPFPRAVKFLATMALSRAMANTAATSTATFTLAKNGSAFATFAFVAAGTTATFTCTSDTSFAAGDILTVVCPSTADATLADIGICLSGILV